MEPAKQRKVRRSRCVACKKLAANHDIVHCGSAETGYRQLCFKCFNTEVASEVGLERFEHIDFEPVAIVDCDGKSHRFHFRTRLFGTGVALDAFELHAGEPTGYQFQMIGEPEEDLMALLGRLIGKIRRALATRHVQKDLYGLRIADHNTVRGLIRYDEDNEGLPLLIVDGRQIEWGQFGRMLMTFEGWQFKLQIHDKSEEL